MESATRGAPVEETPIKLHADEMTIRQYNMFTGVVVLLLGLIFLLTSMIPTAHLMRNRPPADCTSYQAVFTNLQLQCADFSLDSHPILSVDVDDLGSSNEFVSIELTPYEKNSKHQADEITAKIQVNVFAIQQDGTPAIVMPAQVQEIDFDCSDTHSADCESTLVFTLPNIEDKHYYFVLNFLNADDLKPAFSGFAIMTVSMSLVYRNSVFAIKLLLLAVSVIGYFLYSNKISNLKKDFFCQEQKSLQVLTPLLIIINEPITSHIFGGTIYSWIIITLFVLFSGSLMQLWLLIADDLAGSDSSVIERVSRPVQLYLILYLAATWLTYITLHSHITDDPYFGFVDEPGFFANLFKLALYAILLIGFAWMVWKTVRILQRINTSNDRESYFFWFSVFFIFAHFYLVARGGLYPFNHHDAKSVLFSGLFTLYVLSVCYLYQPTPEGIEEAIRRKKYANPEVKNKYHDLEDSREAPPKQTASSQAALQMATLGGTGEAKYQEQVNTAERGLNNEEPKYPYEHKSEDEL